MTQLLVCKNTPPTSPLLNFTAAGCCHINEADPVMSLLRFPPTQIKIEATKHFQRLIINARAQLENQHQSSRWSQEGGREGRAIISWVREWSGTGERGRAVNSSVSKAQKGMWHCHTSSAPSKEQTGLQFHDTSSRQLQPSASLTLGKHSAHPVVVSTLFIPLFQDPGKALP